MTMDHDSVELLLAVNMTAKLTDGTICENVVWKHCSDHVLRFYKTDGSQVTGIEKLSGGSIVVPLHHLTHYKLHCKEER